MTEPRAGTGAEGTAEAVELRAVPGSLPTFFRQLRFDLLTLVRNPASVFFSLVLPLVFLIAFVTINSGGAAAAVYFTPATMIIAAVSATFTTQAITLTYLREYGVLKRFALLPVRVGVLLASRTAAGCVVAGLAILVLAGVAAVGYGVRPEQPLVVAAAMVLMLAVGSALGLAVTPLIGNETTASPITNAISIPLLMVSGAFFPLDTAPGWVTSVASVLPLRPLLVLAHDGYAGRSSVAQLALAAGVAVAWTVVAAALALRFFHLAPRRRR